LLDLRVIRKIKVKIEIASNEELMRSGGRKRKTVLSSVRKRKKGMHLRVLVVVGGGR